MPVSLPELDELFHDAQRRALHLELRDVYAETERFAAWRDGTPYDRGPADAEWHERIRPMVARGVDVRRLRVVSEPVTDYIRYEYDVTAVFNLAAGEQVRWLPRRQATGLLVPPVDFWVFDERLVVWNHVAGDGSSLPRERCDDTSIAKTCVVAFDAVWERGIPHERYRPA